MEILPISRLLSSNWYPFPDPRKLEHLNAPIGCGTRNNEAKRRYVMRHIRDIEYRTWAFKTEKQMTAFENTLKRNADAYTFGT